jgi:hypothetical protein
MPGAVLNPHGRRKGNAIEQLREKYAGRSPKFFEGLIELTKSDSENIRLQALREIFDRLLGRPAVSVDTTVMKMDLGELYRRALVRAKSHVVPSEPVVEGKVNGIAPP